MHAHLSVCSWLQESVSRSGKWPQLPAIAEEPQAALQPALSSGGTGVTRVAARDLEAGLRAALEAQRSLLARRRRRDKLLRAVSKVALFCCQAATARETATWQLRPCAYSFYAPESCQRISVKDMLPCIARGNCNHLLSLLAEFALCKGLCCACLDKALGKCMPTLATLVQAVEVRGHARQQREQFERLRERARQHQSAAQRMQRSAAALQRSLALSSHVAILQAQALADACTAMLVRSSHQSTSFSAMH